MTRQLTDGPVPGRRIAYFGPAPASSGGVSEVATQVIHALAEMSDGIDCYLAGLVGAIPRELAEHERVRIISEPLERYGLSAAGTGTLAFVKGQTLRALAQRRLLRKFLTTHARDRYAVVYQFSQIETFAFSRHLRALPPVVLHPETHARGELTWLRKERRLALRNGGIGRTAVTEAMMMLRSWTQKRHVHRADRIVFPSERFKKHVVADYRLDEGRCRVVPNPIDVSKFSLRTHGDVPDLPVQAVCVGRLSVRKGLDVLIAAVDLLQDLRGQLEIVIIGGHTMWSDYRPDIFRAVGCNAMLKYEGVLSSEALSARLRSAAFAIQPSKYEPFGLTAAEAVASGILLVATDEIGATENLSRNLVIEVAADDPAALAGGIKEAYQVVRSRSARGWTLEEERLQVRRHYSNAAFSERLADALADYL